MVTFIATHLKAQAVAGAGTATIPGVENIANLDVDQIEYLMKQRCPKLIDQFLSQDKDSDGKFTWREIFPMIQDFFLNMWTLNRPKDDDGMPDYPDDEKYAFLTTVEREKSVRDC